MGGDAAEKDSHTDWLVSRLVIKEMILKGYLFKMLLAYPIPCVTEGSDKTRYIAQVLVKPPTGENFLLHEKLISLGLMFTMPQYAIGGTPADIRKFFMLEWKAKANGRNLRERILKHPEFKSHSTLVLEEQEREQESEAEQTSEREEGDTQFPGSNDLPKH
ncbi:hypothetical protein CYMTET_10984 [Cymbomonas tetramitiformis]|uniref:Uncharacterized protein n=1 Tax=Cymbomonas tetramitiformis TaxID=36881 RepID=A0AAE0GNM6_9CHLO|nr:hypothetical protein CYMTET_10984 [Cymbomonas tetramitiformis]